MGILFVHSGVTISVKAFSLDAPDVRAVPPAFHTNADENSGCWNKYRRATFALSVLRDNRLQIGFAFRAIWILTSAASDKFENTNHVGNDVTVNAAYFR